MRPLDHASPDTFRNVRFVLTDMDETLTFNGRLSASTYEALEKLQNAGVKVIPVTAAPAGWCDQMARMWPVDGVIGENGGLFFRRTDDGHGTSRRFWHADDVRASVDRRLSEIAQHVKATVPAAELAEDQPFRMTSLAFRQPDEPELRRAILSAMRAMSADVTVNNLWVLGWLGGYDKLAMAKRILSTEYGVDPDEAKDVVLYVGDSTNDAPMFGYFRHSVGVSTITRYLGEIPVHPNWITVGPGGRGFVEAANAVISAM